MTLRKAKELLSQHAWSLKGKNNPDLRDAIHLGIESIERIESYRRLHVGVDFVILPGETKTDYPP